MNRSVLGDCVILDADDGSTALDIMCRRQRHRHGADGLRDGGPEAVQLMRTELGYRGLVVGITGNALPEDLSNFRDQGADKVITKPL